MTNEKFCKTCKGYGALTPGGYPPASPRAAGKALHAGRKCTDCRGTGLNPVEREGRRRALNIREVTGD